jgi:HlyD family secretion protein
MNIRIAAAALLLLLSAGCGSGGDAGNAQRYEVAKVDRRPLVLTVEAAGVIEPIRTVEIKSKASGEILELGADTGDTVKAGALLVRIDPRTPRNRLDQAQAQLNAAKAKLANARSQLARGEKLLGNAWINPADYDKLVLDAATAESEVVAGRVAVDNARIALDDTEVRAPSDGTILAKRVERGQVISSPTMDVGGGTLLLTMADLARVRAKVRVDETDLGKIAPGMPARITVASFPGRRFAGTIEKIEPQAIVEQNVTLFPVLISLDNEERLLRPGMNVDARFEVARRDDVLTVPVTALRTERDIDTTATITGLDAAAIRAKVGASGEDAAAAAQGSARESATGLGGSFWVVVDRKGTLEAVPITTGITDLDRVEVASGLVEGESVLVLPSSSLVEAQERLQNFMRSRGGIPGMTQKSQDTQGGQGGSRLQGQGEGAPRTPARGAGAGQTPRN